ncbi:MAG: hypothetical protein WCS94_24640, partial [Verrucomicrobiota bacterium]
QFDFPSPARMMPRCVDALVRMAVRVFKPAPSLKPRQKPKILAAHRYIFSVNALMVTIECLKVCRNGHTCSVAPRAAEKRPGLFVCASPTGFFKIASERLI